METPSIPERIHAFAKRVGLKGLDAFAPLPDGYVEVSNPVLRHIALKSALDEHRQELLDIAADLETALTADGAPLSRGPSYIHLGNQMDQVTALMLFSLGEMAGLWKIKTAVNFGAGDFFSDDEVRTYFRNGIYHAVGYKPQERQALHEIVDQALLQEIADGAWGDDPATRGRARDLLRTKFGVTSAQGAQHGEAGS